MVPSDGATLSARRCTNTPVSVETYCSFEPCGRPVWENAPGRGLCRTHYNQARRGEPLRPFRTPVLGNGPSAGPCEVDGCDNPANSHRRCTTHTWKSRAKPPVEKVCPTCDATFETTRDYQRFCSKLCRGRSPKYRAMSRKVAAKFYQTKGLETKFGRPQAELLALLAKGCAVCGDTENLHIDHDHACCPKRGESCGRCIRGVLCRRHNMALGMFRDDPSELARAIDYLKAGAQ